MKFTRNGSVHLIAGAIVGVGVVVAACGGDDDNTGTTPVDGGASTSSGGSSGAASSSGGSSGTASSSGGSSGAPSDGGGEAGGEGGAKKANGEGPCTVGTECQSGECFVGGKDSFCTIKCSMTSQTDPVCQALGAKFSGQCNKKGYCETK